MPQDLLPLDQVAEQLGLHVRTVRSYVREGRLKAVRIGKQYRVAGEDLAAFTGRPAASAGAPAHLHAEVSSIVEVEDIGREGVIRLTNALMAAAKGRGDGEAPLRIETSYDEARSRLKVVILGDLAATAYLLAMLDLRLEASI